MVCVPTNCECIQATAPTTNELLTLGGNKQFKGIDQATAKYRVARRIGLQCCHLHKRSSWIRRALIKEPSGNDISAEAGSKAEKRQYLRTTTKQEIKHDYVKYQVLILNVNYLKAKC